MSAVAPASKSDLFMPRETLRFLTCGSVDDGKSTLIGRLLFDTKLLLDDQLATLERESRARGAAGGGIDFSLLVDGLEAEREQGITIDVAYRFFATARRKFVVADTPGHEQYTRNMATGASTADLAVILVDARKGASAQTRRHSFIASLLGIRHVVLAINKIDLVGYSKDVFESIATEFRSFVRHLPFESIVVIPVSARLGDNVVERGVDLSWYRGPTLIEYLETVDIVKALPNRPFRFPVQWINRPNLDFRGYSGTIAGGSVSIGDKLLACPSGRSSTVRAISTFEGELARATTGQAVTIVLEDAIDISRGELLSTPEAQPEVAEQFSAHLIWMQDEPLIPGRSYWLKTGAMTVVCSVTDLKYKVDADTFQHLAAKDLRLNEIGVANLSTREPIAFDPYAENRATGSFILIDRMTNLTAGAGMIDFALRRSTNIHWQPVAIDKRRRSEIKGHRPVILWFTGLSGAGKSTIANLVEQRLVALGCHTYLLDGDNIRHGLNYDLGFTEVDRVENIRRIAECAKLFVDAGMIVLASFISPFRAERQFAREIVEPGEFVEIFVDTTLSEAERRDPKGLYKRARMGRIKNFTGIDSPYEPPENPEIRLDTEVVDVERSADLIVDFLMKGRYLKLD